MADKLIQIPGRVPQLYLAGQVKEAQAMTRQAQEIAAQADFLVAEAGREILESMSVPIPKGARLQPVRMDDGALALKLVMPASPKPNADGQQEPEERDEAKSASDPMADPADQTVETYA